MTTNTAAEAARTRITLTKIQRETLMGLVRACAAFRRGVTTEEVKNTPGVPNSKGVARALRGLRTRGLVAGGQTYGSKLWRVTEFGSDYLLRGEYARR